MNTIALWVVVPSFALTILVVGSHVWGTPNRVRRRRRQRQLHQLNEAQEQHRASKSGLEIDWVRYREIPKAELIEIVNRSGWALQEERLEERAWSLQFVYAPAEAQSSVEGSALRQRPVGDSAASNGLRRDPAVAVHATGMQHEQGRDGGSSSVARLGPEQHYWTKRMNRQIGLAFVYGVCGLIVLAGTFGSFTPGDGSRFYIMLTVGVVLCVLFAVAVVKARRLAQKLAAARVSSH